MSRYKAYPEYKDSGVEWLESPPKTWEVRRNKAMMTLENRIVGKRSGEYQLLSLTLRGVIPRDISDGSGKIPAEFDTYQIVVPKDLIFCLFDIDETPRTIGIANQSGMITGAYNVYRCLDTCVPEYAYYYFLHIDSFKGLRPFYTGLRKVVRAETFLNIEMFCPSLSEQRKIANFLDHETAKIDTLIAKQQELIKLLKEKRQTVISHAVTKGLNPNAPMRDSGVEWLGEVPAHWEISQPRYLCAFVGGGTPSKDNPAFWDGDIPWVSPKDMKVNYISTALDNISMTAVFNSSAKLIDPGAILIVVRGMILDHSVPVALSEKTLTINQDMKALIPSSKIKSEYLLYALQGFRDAILDLVDSSAHGTKCLRTDQFCKMEIPLPPCDEQALIVEEIKRKLFTIDALVDKAYSMIAFSQERRTALISAAVTGKIDVRDWQPPSDAAIAA